MTSKKELAIIGLACRFPNADNYKEYWELLKRGDNAIKEITADRWDIHKYYSSDFNEEGKSISKWGGLLNDIQSFDYRFFKISPAEAMAMDVQQKLLLQEAARCIEDSGVPLSLLQEKKTAVFIGVMASDGYANAVEKGRLNSYSSLGNYHSILSNRISNFFGFTGESITLDTACSSSLVALHYAKKSLLSGECDYALVGAASIIAHPFRYISFSKARMLSPDGQCKTFDQTANGYVPGEGVSLILLQRQQNAVKNGSTIHGIISGTAVNHTGKGLSITAPKISAQQETIVGAINNASINSNDISYVEAHGTGTSLGDPIEIEALKRAFEETSITERTDSCKIGSVKSNIGHLEAAAGMAGLIKVILMMKNQTLIKTLHITTLNPVINFKASPFKVIVENEPWTSGSEKRYAGISSFGFGGVNAHVILQEYIDNIKNVGKKNEESINYPFLFSAHSEDSLKNVIDQWKKTVRSLDTPFNQLSAHTIFGRMHHPYRWSVTTKSKNELFQSLEQFSNEPDSITHSKKTDVVLLIFDISENKWSDYLEQLKKDQFLFTKFSKTLKKNDIVADLLDDSSIPLLSNDKKRIIHIALLYVITEKRIAELVNVKLLAGSGIAYYVIWMLVNDISLDLSLKYNEDKSIGIKNSSSRKFNIYSAIEKRWLYAIDPADTFYKDIQSSSINGSELDELLDRARELWKYQFTFKNFISEWFVHLSKEKSIHLESILDGKELSLLSPTDINCICLAIIQAIKRLHQKWDLQDKLSYSNPYIECLSDLIIDKVLNYTQAIHLITGNFKETATLDYSKVTSEKYEFLKQYQRQVQNADQDYSKITVENETINQAVKGNMVGHVGSIPLNNIFDFSSIDMSGFSCTDELRQLWNLGVVVNWEACFDFTYQPVSIPVFYPFEIKKMDERPQLPSKITSSVKRLLFHSNSFHKIFNKADDPIIQDHVLCSHSIVPAAAMIEMVADSIAELQGNGLVKMEKMQFLKPVMINEIGNVTIEINANTFKIHYEQGIVASGKFSKQEEVIETKINQQNFPNEKFISGKKVYDFLKQKGYAYGQSLQVINELVEKDDSIFYKLKSESDTIRNPFLSAHLLDGIFHTVLWAAQQFHNAFDQADELFVPFTIGETIVYHPLSASCEVTLKKQNVSVSRSQILAHVFVYSNERLCLELKEIVLQKVQTNFLNNYKAVYHKALAASTLYCKSVWVEKELVKIEEKPLHIVLFEEAGIKEKEEKKDNAFDFTFSLSAVLLDNTLLTKWIEVNTEKKILIQLLLSPSGNVGIKAVDRLYAHIEFVFNLIKNKLNQKNKNTLFIQVLSSGSIIADLSSSDFSIGALAGFSKTMLLESSKARIQLVDNDSQDPQEQILKGFQEATAVSPEPEVCYRKGRRFIRNYETIETVFANPYVVSDEDCIMVIGGTGGIGLEVCKYLCANSNATIIIVGRKPEQEVKEKLSSLRSSNRTGLQYYSCDTSNDKAVETLFASLEQNKSRLTGIIHAGGMLEDKFLLNKSWESFKKVLDSKIKSTVLIHQYSLPYSLKFFSVFSSAVTLTGNIGQTDYTTANMFLNQFIQYRNMNYKECKNSVINWTLWEDTGMGKQAFAKTALEKMGLAAINCKQGIDAWIRILGSNESDVTVLGATSTIKESFNKKISSNEITKKQDPTVAMNISEKLSMIIGNAIGMEEPIQDDVDFREYGVDSVAINTIVQNLTTIYGQHVYPSLIMEYPTLKELSAYFLTHETNSTPVSKVEVQNSSQENELEHPQQSKEELNYVKREDSTSKEKITEILKSIIANVIDMEPSQLEDDVDFREYGIDSVAINTIINKLSEHFKNGIYPSLLIENPTINEISAHLLKEGNLTNQHEFSFKEKSFVKLERNELPSTAEKRELPDLYADKIAIIGFAGRFPQSPVVEMFWENLIAGRDTISSVPKMRWDIQKHFDASGVQHKSYVKKGGFIENIDFFDAAYFRIADAEAKNIDPQQRLFLELTQELLDRSGYKKEELKDSLTGIFIGANESNYARKFDWRNKFYGKQGVVNVVSNLIAGRIADFYDFTGPAQVCYTACSSSLVALQNACLALKNGDCDQAIAGGIELLVDEEWFVGFSNSKALSRDGKAKVFDENADGFVLSEGLGAVFLKPFKKAIEDGDQIHGVIVASSINNDGSTMGLTTPNLKAQKRLLKKALVNGNINPETITYFEAHGTGTPLGDPTEIKAATEVFREYSDKKQWCALGSVKSNIGHTLSAAGIAGVIKILLSFNNKIIPPTINCLKPNSKFDFDKSPFYPVTSLEEWDVNAIPRRAAVSSFGFGGTNVHFILDEFDALKHHYFPSRKQLPLTKFNRKSYWITDDDSHESHTIKDVLQRLSAKDISIDEARKELNHLQLI